MAHGQCAGEGRIPMSVSVKNSQIVYDALKGCGIRLMSALPETWLVHLIRLADEDPDMTLVRLAKEEEGVGISAGAHLAGVKSAMLMQNHGLLASINGIVSAAQLQSLGHRPNFFYLQHAMGLASSMGLGIALTRPEHQVIVFDGDGSVLMNLGGLTTLARYQPRNLVHVVFDNESLLSVGGFPTATSTGSDLAKIAQAAGVPRTSTVSTLDDFTRAFDEAVAAK